MTFYNQLSQVFGYSGTLFNRPPGGTLLLRRLHGVDNIDICWHNPYLELNKTMKIIIRPQNYSILRREMPVVTIKS